MSKDELIEKAKALGLETEGLTVEQLKAVIKEGKKAGKEFLEGKVNTAKQAFIDLPEDAADDQKQTSQQAVEDAEAKLKAFLEEWFPPNPFKKGEDDDNQGDSGDENDNKGATAPAATPPAGKAPSATAGATGTGKAKKAKREVFTLDGIDYVFTRNTPERFNFLGKNKAREEWMADDVAMELLVKGNSQYIKPLKK